MLHKPCFSLQSLSYRDLLQSCRANCSFNLQESTSTLVSMMMCQVAYIISAATKSSTCSYQKAKFPKQTKNNPYSVKSTKQVLKTIKYQDFFFFLFTLISVNSSRSLNLASFLSRLGLIFILKWKLHSFKLNIHNTHIRIYIEKSAILICICLCPS